MKDTLKAINEKIQPYLDIEDNAFWAIYRKPVGCSYGNIKTVSDEVIREHDRLNANEKDWRLKPAINLCMDIIYKYGSVNGKSVFYFKRGEDAVFRDFDLNDITDDIVKRIRKAMHENGYSKVESDCVFYIDPELGLMMERKSLVFKGKKREKILNVYLGIHWDQEVMYHKAEKSDRIFMEVTDDSFLIKSSPEKTEIDFIYI